MNVSFSSLVLSKFGVPFYASSETTKFRTASFTSCKFSKFWNPSLYISDVNNRLNCIKTDFRHSLTSSVVFSDKNAVVNNTDAIYYTGKKFFYDSGPNIFYKCTFADCNANGKGHHFDSGGAVQALFSNKDVMAPIFYLKLEECGFFNCTAKNCGGAICVHTVKIQSNFCLFKNCSSPNGGGFYANNCSEEILYTNHTFISGLSVRKSVDRLFGFAFTESKVYLNHMNFSRIKEAKLHGPLISGIDVPYFHYQFSYIDHSKGKSLIFIQNSNSKEMIFQYALFKICEASEGIMYVNITSKPLKCRDMYFIRCNGQFFSSNDTTLFIIDNCFVNHPSLMNDDEATQVKNVVRNYTNFKVGTPNFNVSYPRISDWYYVMAHDRNMFTVSKPFTPTVTFLPTNPFTPSCTLSGIMFVRNGMKWYEFRKSVHTVTTVNLQSLFTDTDDIL
ncbi:hypothetical protein TVAG_463390 [Trichomonas vaginalis G3]|uniref:Uncharacterized protein n=1 Tax=Trichomonas vaginalis (strain ATCC PRA-98 / G3) TaxID=412133 RepID=A2EH11_TRIV3|nr:hypothetical protein TVAGG3_0077900 [Trichomonas vaginalis G3]EAY08059.1 hypothetical protein TVAG_463390 [Trichomonas vaginalis G3]KAI5543024.1 hypothetical protein TVAGG3_0077900 [Trichomonas vaginalis G3]|eukprot:XP_001320282.1 hypothetical protein [Trichomonas vaginalis G3]